MDVAGNPRPLLGDGAPNSALADRTPDADEQDGEGKDAEEVAREDVVARASGAST